MHGSKEFHFRIFLSHFEKSTRRTMMTRMQQILTFFIVQGLLALGAASLPAQTSGPQGTVAARFGPRRIGPSHQSSAGVAEAGSAAQSGATFGFGLIDFPRSPDSTAFGVNSKNEIVGIYGANLPQWEGMTQSFLLNGDGFHPLAYPGAPYTSAFGINKHGEIVGWYYDASGNGISHAFQRKGTVYTTVDFPGAQNSAAININDAGEIIGLYWNDVGSEHGFTLIKGVYASFDPPASYDTFPQGINSSGVIVGNYLDSNDIFHGFLFENGKFTTLDYPGSSNTVLNGINDKGQILGGYGDDVAVGSESWPTPRVFLLDRGIYTTFAPPVGDAQVTWAYTLYGDNFVGFYIDSLGNIYGYEATVNP
jgi:YD repeat-containing protein